MRAVTRLRNFSCTRPSRKQLAGKTSLTRDDVRDEATSAIIAGDAAPADVSVRELIGSHAEPADWLLSAQLSIQKNLRDEAKRAEWTLLANRLKSLCSGIF